MNDNTKRNRYGQTRFRRGTVAWLGVAAVVILTVGCAGGPEAVDLPADAVYQIPAVETAETVGGGNVVALEFVGDGSHILAVHFFESEPLIQRRGGTEYVAYEGVMVELIVTADGTVGDRVFIQNARAPSPAVRNEEDGSVHVGLSRGEGVSVDASAPWAIDVATRSSQMSGTSSLLSFTGRKDAISPDRRRVITAKNSEITVRVVDPDGPSSTTEYVSFPYQTNRETEKTEPVEYAGWLGSPDRFYVFQGRSELWTYSVSDDEPTLAISSQDFWRNDLLGVNHVQFVEPLGTLFFDVTSSQWREGVANQLWALAVRDNGTLRRTGIAGLIHFPEWIAASPGLENEFVLDVGYSREQIDDDRSVAVWSLDPLEPRYALITSDRADATSAAIDPSGTLLAVGTNAGTIDIWNLRDRQPVLSSAIVSGVSGVMVPRLRSITVLEEDQGPPVRRTVTIH